MLLLLRRMKHDVFMKREFHKYLGYAVGELLLVIVGILIALQIDNWNEERKEQATLQSYLQSVVRNMQEDLAEFAPNDLSRLTVPLGFNFSPAQEPATFSIRNVHFR